MSHPQPQKGPMSGSTGTYNNGIGMEQRYSAMLVLQCNVFFRISPSLAQPFRSHRAVLRMHCAMYHFCNDTEI